MNKEILRQTKQSLITEHQNTTDALLDLSSFRPRIKLDKNVFVLTTQDMPQQKTLQCVIIGTSKLQNAKASKKYYATSYAIAKEACAPTCKSFNGIVPDDDVVNPICSSCSLCPNNMWGSDLNSSSKAKACKDYIRLALYFPLPFSDTQDDVEALNIYRLDIPAASLKVIGEYAAFLNRGRQSISNVMTEISFDTTSKFTKLKFKNLGVITDDIKQLLIDDSVQSLVNEILFDNNIVIEETIKENTNEPQENDIEKRPLLVRPTSTFSDVQVKSNGIKKQSKVKKVQISPSNEIAKHCETSDQLNPSEFAKNIDDDINI